MRAFAPGPLAALSPKPSLSSLVFKMQKLAPGRFGFVGRFGCQQQNRGRKEVPGKYTYNLYNIHILKLLNPKISQAFLWIFPNAKHEFHQKHL